VDEERLNAISLAVIQSAIEVHRALGPGLLERVYQVCLSYELRQRGLTIVTERVLPIYYKSVVFDVGYRIDMLVEDEVIVELKSVETVLPVHYAQLLSYLRLADKRWGLFVNFSVPILVKGLKRIVNKF
jgi:GxxExxY protein